MRTRGANFSFRLLCGKILLGILLVGVFFVYMNMESNANYNNEIKARTNYDKGQFNHTAFMKMESNANYNREIITRINSHKGKCIQDL